MAELPNDFKPPWPGPIYKEADDPFLFLDRAIELIAANWTDCAAGAVIAERCHHWQIELYAMNVAHAELLNGGFCQFLFNGSGELAEEAVRGFGNFELSDIHELFDKVFSHLERPITKNRLERINMLFQHFDVEKTVFGSVKECLGADFRAARIFQLSAPFFDPFTDQYYELVKLSRNDIHGWLGWGLPICNFVDRHKEIFFRLD